MYAQRATYRQDGNHQAGTGHAPCRYETNLDIGQQVAPPIEHRMQVADHHALLIMGKKPLFLYIGQLWG
ncbi:hypothetical protein M107_3784 [Bacteroides fragilis str. 3725 D9(v)]|jgi:hypothetical protein|uniref:Uncharacterized protein n=1 Tax=Bacteroides fragilis str. 1007-1-F \|nr:hypothetical protein M101_3510 [Bacteroides fragilis str. 1007-1-F \